MKVSLVIMAAGLGSRYGGSKQVDGIGPHNEILMEYSIYDALRAGFSKVVFIIKPEMEEMMRRLCGDYLARKTALDGTPVEVAYVFQDFTSVPDFYRIPPERTKPFGTVELLARIRAVLRRNQGAVEASGAVDDDIPLVCGDISMQVGQHQVTVRGESVFFPLKEFELLEYLMQNKGRVMTRHQLIDRIWGSDYVGDTKTLDVHVKRVRSKIEEDPAHPQYLTTVRGLGYKIDSPQQ